MLRIHEYWLLIGGKMFLSEPLAEILYDLLIFASKVMQVKSKAQKNITPLIFQVGHVAHHYEKNVV
jgi:hypothetical protein